MSLSRGACLNCLPLHLHPYGAGLRAWPEEPAADIFPRNKTSVLGCVPSAWDKAKKGFDDVGLVGVGWLVCAWGGFEFPADRHER
jgi:hypothetical protein